ncbi:MAG: hypothetical protein ABIL22_07880 [candidate division WOR-3 bacterium]
MKISLLLFFCGTLFANPPWIPNIKVSQDPGTGNQNETTMANYQDTLFCGGWNDNRLTTYHVGFARSTNSGTTWAETLMYEPTYPGDCDPCIVVNDSGHICYVWLSYNASNYTGDIFLTKSRDWGRTWGTSLCLTPGTPSTLDDKPWSTVDGNYMFLTWYDYGGTGALRFKYSTDYGQTWSAGVSVGSGGNGTTAFRGTGQNLFVGWGMQDIRLNRSTNLGSSWLGQQTIITCPWSPPSTPYRLNNIPSFATSRDRTRLYVVFADSRWGSNQLDVSFSRSTDQGVTWSTPVKINDTPAGDTTLQFYPWVAVDPNDNIHVVWHDTRGRSRYWIGQYYAYSTNYGTTWSTNQRISDTVAYANAFIGDYTACTAGGQYIAALWCDCRNGQTNPDIYFSRCLNQIGVEEITKNKTVQYGLKLIFPNPFTRGSRIVYYPADAQLTIYQIDGQKVDAIQRPGIYFVQLKKDRNIITRKLIKIN